MKQCINAAVEDLEGAAQRDARRVETAFLGVGMVSCVLGLAGCASSSSSSTSASDLELAPPGPGVIFSYPVDGQYDVTAGTLMLLTFSEALPPPPLRADAGMGGYGPCVKAANQVTGTFCVEGPNGFVDGRVGIDVRRLSFAPIGGFAEGATYRVYARPGMLEGGTNLPVSAPLLTFHTRSERTQAGVVARVLTVNGLPPVADGGSTLPFLDEAPLRLVFSEPVDPATVNPQNVRLVHVADSKAVDGQIVTDGIHLTFDPATTLQAGDDYRFVLTAAVHDLGGEAIAPVTIAFAPRRTAAPDAGLYRLDLIIEPPWLDGGVSQPQSGLSPMPANSNLLSAPLVGKNTLGVMSGGLESLVGNPQILGTPIPMLIRRGQRLDLTSMSIRFGGVLEAGLKTGIVHFTMLTDAFGFLKRNPLRAAEQTPDDAEAPVYVDLTMDALVTSEDTHGNVISTQTVMGIHLLGLSTLDGDQLAIEQVGAMDFSTLGINVAPVNLAMRLRTGSRPAVASLPTPVLISSFPAEGATGVSPGDPIELNFSGPMDPARIRDGVELKLTEGATVIPTTTQLRGSTLVIRPSRRLSDGVAASLNYTGLRSFAGGVVAEGTLSFTTGVISATLVTPPIITAISPGAPCALNASGPGRCAGGLSTDTSYQPFTLSSNRDIHVQFSQPMDPASLTLGAGCGQGSLRVELVDASGTCTAVVVGTLTTSDREVRFQANQPWKVGGAYRLTLVGGSTTSCGAGKICGRNGQPLNTDPLAGATSSAAGGPDVVIDFTGTAATPDSYQPLESDPFADLNGNGYLDAAETANDKNRVVMELGAYSGIITDASLVGDDCMPERAGQQVCSYIHATLPSSVGRLMTTCPIDASGRPASVANPCIEVQVYPSLIIGTSITMNTAAIGISIGDLPTGMMVMRLREKGGPIFGYIMREPGVADPQFVITNHVYFDNPDIEVPLASIDLHSKEMVVTLKGPVTFRPDGKMDTSLRSTHDVLVTANLSAILKVGSIDLKIPAGEMRITLGGPLLR